MSGIESDGRREENCSCPQPDSTSPTTEFSLVLARTLARLWQKEGSSAANTERQNDQTRGSDLS